MSKAGRSAHRSLTGAVVVAAALVMLGASVSSAAAAPATSTLTLSVTEETFTGETSSAALLTCDPAGGTHPQPQSACEQLTEVDGDFSKLTNDDYVCTQEYAPVTARAVGQWQGQAVNFAKTYSNACMLNAETGGVFAF